MILMNKIPQKFENSFKQGERNCRIFTLNNWRYISTFSHETTTQWRMLSWFFHRITLNSSEARNLQSICAMHCYCRNKQNTENSEIITLHKCYSSSMNQLFEYICLKKQVLTFFVIAKLLNWRTHKVEVPYPPPHQIFFNSHLKLKDL